MDEAIEANVVALRSAHGEDRHEAGLALVRALGERGLAARKEVAALALHDDAVGCALADYGAELGLSLTDLAPTDVLAERCVEYLRGVFSNRASDDATDWAWYALTAGDFPITDADRRSVIVEILTKVDFEDGEGSWFIQDQLLAPLRVAPAWSKWLEELAAADEHARSIIDARDPWES